MPEESDGKPCVRLPYFDLLHIFPFFSLYPKIEYSPEIDAEVRTIVLLCKAVQ